MNTFSSIARAIAIFGAGAVGGILIGVSCRNPELHEINPILLEMAKQMFSNFENNKIIKVLRVPLIDGCHLDVAIVEQANLAEFGFVRVTDPVRFFWISKDDGVEFKKYDEHHLLAIVRTRDIHKFQRVK